MTEMVQPTNEWVAAVLDRLLAADFHGNEALREQSDVAETARIEYGEGAVSISFKVDPAVRHASVPLRVPVEGKAADTDGREIYALLHVVDGLLHELEIVRLDGLPIRELPAPERLVVEVQEE